MFPMKNYKFHFTNLRFILFSALVVSVYTTVERIIEIIQETYGLGSFFGFSGRALFSPWPLYVYITLLVILIFSTNHSYSDAPNPFIQKIDDWFSKLGNINFLIIFLLIGLFCVKILFNLDIWIFTGRKMVFILYHLALLGAFQISRTKKIAFIPSLVLSLSIYALILYAIYWIPSIQSYPLTIGWSEGSRYYYASLFFSERLYGFQAPLPSLHPSRYMMQSVAFLFSNTSIWVHRFWQVVLWIVISLATGLALVRRIKPKSRWLALGVVAWFILFIFQGPVYYHLLVVILMILLGFNRHNLKLSLLFVIIASLWAGISRVNWFPVAGMLAAVFYILEIPQEKKTFWQYWWWPVATVFIGLAVAFGSKAFYVLISGKGVENFTSSFNSPLLLYRLFPNRAFGPGILLMLVIACLFSIIIIIKYLLPNVHMWRPLRLWGLFSILTALMISGLIVSIKIGGGNNLHNMDAFLVFLALIMFYVVFYRFTPEDQNLLQMITPPITWVSLGVLVLMISLMGNMRHFPLLDNDLAWQNVRIVQEIIDDKVTEGGEVLFIHNRHLLTFNMIEGVKLVPEYEKVFLMEMAMSENESFLSNFKQDISNNRFDVIVTEPLFIKIRDSSAIFAEENNAWVTHVAIPLSQYYQTVFEADESALWVMVPKPLD